jgi:RNA polymerase sigma-70 factor (ECF subfamily)
MTVPIASSGLTGRATKLQGQGGARDDSARWFDALGRAQIDRAYRLAGLILGSASEAEDVTQEALLRAWRRRRSLRDGTRAQAWFDRILVNACRDRLRRRRPTVRWLDIGDDGPGPGSDPFAAIFVRDEVLRSLASLSSDHRIVLVLRYWADLPVDAIADRLGVPPGTVKSRLHYALDAIRAEIQRS